VVACDKAPQCPPNGGGAPRHLALVGEIKTGYTFRVTAGGLPGSKREASFRRAVERTLFETASKKGKA